MKYSVLKEEKLIDYLLNKINGLSKNKIKSLLKHQEVLVNGKIITNANYILQKNDEVIIIKNRIKNDFEILYEDKDIIVVNKKAGLLTISTTKEKKNTLYHQVSDYIKSQNKKNNIFIIHRLDRDTSGIVIFAKSKRIKKLYQDNWNQIVINRIYIAIVEGSLKEKKGTIQTYLKENKEGYVYSAKTGKLAITEYEVLKENELYSLLKITIKTGRKNQIRVHMKEYGNTIVGDKKYGSKIKTINRLYLHANILEILNPITKQLEKYEVEVPEEFYKLF